jgi:hypothetical protein
MIGVVGRVGEASRNSRVWTPMPFANARSRQTHLPCKSYPAHRAQQARGEPEIESAAACFRNA